MINKTGALGRSAQRVSGGPAGMDWVVIGGGLVPGGTQQNELNADGLDSFRPYLRQVPPAQRARAALWLLLRLGVRYHPHRFYFQRARSACP